MSLSNLHSIQILSSCVSVSSDLGKLYFVKSDWSSKYMQFISFSVKLKVHLKNYNHDVASLRENKKPKLFIAIYGAAHWRDITDWRSDVVGFFCFGLGFFGIFLQWIIILDKYKAVRSGSTRSFLGVWHRSGPDAGAQHRRITTASGKERWKLVEEEVYASVVEEGASRAVAMQQQSACMKWKQTTERNFTWQDMWEWNLQRIEFLIQGVCNVLQSPSNLLTWGKVEKPACWVRSKKATFEHILSSCSKALCKQC